MAAAHNGVCFVTVGTTRFDALVERFEDPGVHDELKTLGVNRVLLQIGHGKDLDSGVAGASTKQSSKLLPMESFRFSPSIEAHMRGARLVVSHAGAGSIMEALGLRAPLLVVVNDALMDNHQAELADALALRNHLVRTTPRQLTDALADFPAALTPYPSVDLGAFPALVDDTMGFTPPASGHEKES